MKAIFSLIIILISTLLSQAQTATKNSLIVDQIVATINGEPITQSDIVWALVLDPSIDEGSISGQNYREMLERLIDQRLFLSEAARIPNILPTQADISREIGVLIKQFSSEDDFYKRIRKYGINAETLIDLIGKRLLILNYIDFRFRSFAIITDEEIQNYFQNILKPKLSVSGKRTGETPTEKERSLIEQILIEEKVDKEIEKFLENSRQRADISLLTDIEKE
ncbi:MAG: hypothetical protein JNN15_01045 [Blastocatellia bacterium]|nr:hypothetical protein [Blastocatellia bacterium]